MVWQVVTRYGRSFATGFIVGLPIYITLTDYGYCIARVDGISMQPALNPENKKSDVVLIDRWSSKDVFNIRRGDVVSLTSPSDPDVKLIKRVIGLEGDVVKTLGYKKRYVSIPKGHCWLEGDNRGKSFDSNKFGPVSLGLVNGIATRIVWPPKRWMKITRSVDSDRIPLKRSFNQCTFSEMLKKTDDKRKDSDCNSASEARTGPEISITSFGNKDVKEQHTSLTVGEKDLFSDINSNSTVSVEDFTKDSINASIAISETESVGSKILSSGDFSGKEDLSSKILSDEHKKVIVVAS
eukprot:gene1981-17527_t